MLAGLNRASDTSTEAEPPLERDTSPWREPGAPDCDICGGAGFVRLKRPLGHPEFGRARPCSCREAEIAARTAERLQRLSNLGPLTSVRLSDEQAAEEPWSLGCRFADASDDERGWLLMSGPGGSGRTHLAAAMANRRIADGREALYFVAADLLDRLRNAMSGAMNAPSEGGLSYELLFEHVREAPFLILDDIDVVSPTDWAREKLYQLLNHRRNGGLRTVLIAESADPSSMGLQMLLTADVERLDLAPPADAGRYRQFGGMEVSLLAEYTFDGFREHGLGGAGDAENLGTIKRMVQDWTSEPFGWLTLYGGIGVGKTHLAAAAAAERLAAGDSACFAVVPDLLDALRASYRPEGEGSFDSLFAALKEVDLLVLDDLGAHQETQWANEKLYQLCASRYVRGAPMIITTNVLLDDLDQRLASRIADSQRNQVLHVKAKDYRTQAAPREVSPPALRPSRQRVRRARKQG